MQSDMPQGIKNTFHVLLPNNRVNSMYFNSNKIYNKKYFRENNMSECHYEKILIHQHTYVYTHNYQLKNYKNDEIKLKFYNHWKIIRIYENKTYHEPIESLSSRILWLLRSM